MTKVVGINGDIPPQAGVPSECLVDFLEATLEEARSGRLQGLACAVLFDNGASGWHVVGRVGGLHMMGALEMCKSEIADVNRDR